ncbi:MAG: hypothetical protein V4693_06015 [Pseudomonadota bacterium]
MPIPNDYRSIVAALIEKTQKSELDWFLDSLHTSVKVDESKFSIWSGNDERNDEPFVAFGLSNAKQAFGGQFMTKMIDSWYVDETDPDYASVYELYRAAQRYANGVPTLLMHLANRLNEGKEPDHE